MTDTDHGLYLEPDWLPALSAFAPSELGRLIHCAISYSTTGRAMDLPGKERVLWPFLQSQIDRKGSAPYGDKKSPCKRGRGEALPAAGEKTQVTTSADAEETAEKEENTPPHTPPVKEERVLSSPIKSEVINNNNINNTSKKGFTPPTLEDVTAYCRERGNSVDPKQFYDYYNEGGWKDQSGKPVLNWKQKMIAVWEKDPPAAAPAKKKQYTTAAEYQAPQKINREALERIKAEFGGG